MHPKRIFAIIYTGGLIALLWYGISNGPAAISNWWWTDWSRQSYGERLADIDHDFDREFFQRGITPTDADLAEFKAKLAAVPKDK